jgi:hypothetical protein
VELLRFNVIIIHYGATFTGHILEFLGPRPDDHVKLLIEIFIWQIPLTMQLKYFGKEMQKCIKNPRKCAKAGSFNNSKD